jgi:GNAT superfamily N-acetyltransferase
MAPLSQTSSLEYTESSKREELFDETGRFLLLRTNTDRGRGYGHGEDFNVNVDMPGALPMKTESGLGDEAGEVLGYVSFRFDTEETLGSRDAEVIYWYVPSSSQYVHTLSHYVLEVRRADFENSYELQLDPSVRKMGLAKVLMDEMESIGRKRKMDKAMLTCLKGTLCYVLPTRPP